MHALVGHFVEYLTRAPIGFDEASGNFQRVNAGGAGRGGDYIRTEVNDGQGLNNANFATPADGLAPRMQMFLFDRFDTNGSESADVVYHEIGHGLSTRLVVNASGVGALGTLQSSMMGEAWSDFYAMDLLVHEGHLTDTAAPGEIRTGTHVVGPNGVRSKPIDCPVTPAGIDVCNRNGTAAVVLGGYTYGDIKDTNNPPVGGPHNGGEVWAETLWDIRTAVGHEAALALITGGLRLTPDNPSMLDARDAILRQALAMRSASGAADDYYARLWAIFQRRGMGFDATTPNADSENPVESFAPPRHQISLRDPVLSDPYPGGDNDGRTEPGERVEVSASVFSPGITDLTGVTGTLSSAATGVTIVDGNAAWPLLGNGRTLANSDSLAVRMPASCETLVPLTVSVTSGVGAATVTANADPRGSSRTTVALADTPTNGVPAVTEATYVVTGGGTITDVNARIDDLRHPFLGDLKIELIHDGVTVTLFEPPTLYDADDIVGAVFDSDSANPVVNAGAGPVSGTMRPQNPTGLNQFDGHSAAGVWTLRITDDGAGDGGVLREWGVQGPVSEFPCPRLEIPGATTGAAAAVTADSATVNGAVVPARTRDRLALRVRRDGRLRVLDTNAGRRRGRVRGPGNGDAVQVEAGDDLPLPRRGDPRERAGRRGRQRRHVHDRTGASPRGRAGGRARPHRAGVHRPDACHPGEGQANLAPPRVVLVLALGARHRDGHRDPRHARHPPGVPVRRGPAAQAARGAALHAPGVRRQGHGAADPTRRGHAPPARARTREGSLHGDARRGRRRREPLDRDREVHRALRSCWAASRTPARFRWARSYASTMSRRSRSAASRPERTAGTSSSS